ncbi:hypothetical protein HKD37_17G048424 [Glycine soja]
MRKKTLAQTQTPSTKQTNIYMEPEFWDKNPFKATDKAFPSDFHFKPIAVNKTRTFYEIILVDSNSVSIKHFKDPKDQSLNTHSTIQILKVLQPRHFGSDLKKGKKFSVPFDPIGYTYWDYVEAWTKNTRFKHSWHIYFKTNTVYNFPNWFLKWWDFFGPIPEIFPKQVQQGFAQFKKKYTSQEPRIPMNLKYFSSFAMSWIFSWQYCYSKSERTNQFPSLQRHAFVKLWFQSHPEFLKATDPKTSVFLNQKSQLAAFLADSRSKESLDKNLKEVLQILQEEEGSSSKKEEASSSEEELEEDPFYQNEDDCFVKTTSHVTNSQIVSVKTTGLIAKFWLYKESSTIIIDKETLRKDFYSSEIEPQRRWFFQHFKGPNRKQIQDKFYEFFERVKINVLFFDWFQAYTIKEDIDYTWKQDIIGDPTTNAIWQIKDVHLRQKDINPINSKHWKTPFKLYYQRPTTPDLLLEERGENNFKSFSANNIYEWNIDAQTEYNIMNTLQHMTMVVTAYQTSHECSEETIIDILTDLNGKVITNDDNKDIPDVVNTLIFTIAQHFIGDPSLWKDRSTELLSNLKCRTLVDFRWYRDTFLTRRNSQQPFWKEKFLAGLPRSLGDKVRDKIHSQPANGDIPFESLSYGQLISYVQKVALKICQDDKIQRQLAKEKAQTKRDLGSFYEQFGLPTCPKQKKQQSSTKETQENKISHNKRFPRRRYSHKPSTSKEIENPKQKLK